MAGAEQRRSESPTVIQSDAKKASEKSSSTKSSLPSIDSRNQATTMGLEQVRERDGRNEYCAIS